MCGPAVQPRTDQLRNEHKKSRPGKPGAASLLQAKLYFFAARFLAAGFLAAAFFLAAGFLAAVFLAAGFLAAVFLAAGFLAAAFFFAATFFLAAGFLAAVFLDRKSTRLNSSQITRMYAVYCLKKKK